jgi:hypothetical protein
LNRLAVRLFQTAGWQIVFFEQLGQGFFIGNVALL